MSEPLKFYLFYFGTSEADGCAQSSPLCPPLRYYCIFPEEELSFQFLSTFFIFSCPFQSLQVSSFLARSLKGFLLIFHPLFLHLPFLLPFPSPSARLLCLNTLWALNLEESLSLCMKSLGFKMSLYNPYDIFIPIPVELTVYQVPDKVHMM